ncbi:MAG: hypothetical protein ABI333_05975 [bacterium]
MLRYDDIPLPLSGYGERLYDAGRNLVAEHGVRLARLVFDADEVLWDWVVHLGRILRGVPRALFTWEIGHREFFRIKPGIFELVWGMRHESLARGEDPYLRVWTNGYPWRLWRIGLELEALGALVGPPAEGASTPEDWASHPRVFYRPDYVEVALRLLDPAARAAALAELPERARYVLGRQLGERPEDSTLKMPELAGLAGKDGFAESMVLIDDESRNVGRFVASGRRGIQLAYPSYSMFGGRLPNTIWRDPWEQLAELSTAVAPLLVDALREVHREGGPRRLRVRSTEPVRDYVHYDFTIDVLDSRVRKEWLVPRRRLQRAVRARGEARGVLRRLAWARKFRLKA